MLKLIQAIAISASFISSCDSTTYYSNNGHVQPINVISSQPALETNNNHDQDPLSHIAPPTILSDEITTSSHNQSFPPAHAPAKSFINKVIKDVSSRGNSIISCIHEQSKTKIKDIRTPERIRGSPSTFSLQSISAGLRRNVLENNIRYHMDLPFSGRGGSTPPIISSPFPSSSTKSAHVPNMNTGAVNTSVRSKVKQDMEKEEKKQRKQLGRQNNTGFYYGIQDDVFFKKEEKRNNSKEERNVIINEKREQQQQQGIKPFVPPNNNRQRDANSGSTSTRPSYSSSDPSSSSTLSDVMGETLLELREMREDIMALREEMHYMKEEMKRNFRMRSRYDDDYDDTNKEYDDEDELDEEEINSEYRSSNQENQNQVGSLAKNILRRQEFEMISKDVEKWAHKLLFEEDNEANGWKEVVCNKMVRSKFNRDGKTKCYLKWMKDSRTIRVSSTTESNGSEILDSEYPCIKCYGTLNAPIEDVCDYLSKESNMVEYNDLIVAYKDLENITPQSKICWSQCPQILFIKPRDFVTFCHHRWRKDGTQIIINQACEHQDAPGNYEEGDGKLCRAHALRGANFISRDPDDPNKTRLAILAHANPGGGIPLWAMKTGVNALAPIEPFKLFHKIDVQVCASTKNKTNLVNNNVFGYKQRPAGLAQLGYACFWP